MRISYLTIDTLVFDDDVNGAFRYCKYHPDTAALLSFIIEDLLFVLSEVHLIQSLANLILNQYLKQEHIEQSFFQTEETY